MFSVSDVGLKHGCMSSDTYHIVLFAYLINVMSLMENCMHPRHNYDNVWKYMCTHTCVQHRHAHTHAHAHTQMQHTCTHTHRDTHTHTHARTHTQTHTDAYTHNTLYAYMCVRYWYIQHEGIYI